MANMRLDKLERLLTPRSAPSKVSVLVLREGQAEPPADEQGDEAPVRLIVEVVNTRARSAYLVPSEEGEEDEPSDEELPDAVLELEARLARAKGA